MLFEAAPLDQVPIGTSKLVRVADKDIALFNVDGTIYAIGDTCIHQGSSLSQGRVAGKVVTCRGHGWRFDLTTGYVTSSPGVGVPSYPVEIVDGKIMLDVDKDKAWLEGAVRGRSLPPHPPAVPPELYVASVPAVKNLGLKAWASLATLGLMMALLLFVPAGTLHYWQAWLYLSVFTGASALVTLDLLRNDRALLERRMKGGPTAEQRPLQKLIMLGASGCFIALLVVPALDHRFVWSSVPTVLVVAGDTLVAIGFYLIARVYRENSFTSATIEVMQNQTVISTGPYAVVRHPMYASTLLYLLGTPLALGSYWGFVPIAVMIPFLIWRLLDEERLLSRHLPGYTDYRRRVRRRLVPFVW